MIMDSLPATDVERWREETGFDTELSYTVPCVWGSSRTTLGVGVFAEVWREYPLMPRQRRGVGLQLQSVSLGAERF